VLRHTYVILYIYLKQYQNLVVVLSLIHDTTQADKHILNLDTK